MKLILYRLFQATIMWPIMLVATVLTALTTIILCSLGLGRWAGYYPEVAWARIMCMATLVRVTVEGKENIDKDTSYVFVCNHQGAYDIFSVYAVLGHQFRWMMKQSLRNIPLVGYACKMAKQIFVDKSSPSAIKHTMQAAEKILQGGMSIVVFPEGARTWDGNMRPFRRGAFLLATEFNMPVVPVTIDGSFKVMPRYSKLPHWGHIKLTIHKPINPPEGGYNLPELMQEAFDIINGSLPATHKKS